MTAKGPALGRGRLVLVRNIGSVLRGRDSDPNNTNSDPTATAGFSRPTQLIYLSTSSNLPYRYS